MLTIIYSVCSVSNLTHSPWAKKKKRRKLTGAAKTAREAKLARGEARKGSNWYQTWEACCCCECVWGQAGRSHLKNRGLFSKEQGGGWSCRDFAGVSEGISCRGNLVRDILLRDDAGLKNLADGIRRWVFYPSKYLLRTRSSCSD